MIPVAAGHALAPAPAASYARARAAGLPAGITSAYRSPERQAVLRAQYLANPTTVAYAAPVGKSEHVTGYALDLPEPARTWMARYGRQYGWIRTDPREAWHYAYRAALDTHLLDSPATIPPPAPATPTLEDTDMVNDIYELYRRLLGREPSTDEILDRLSQTPVQVRDACLAAPPSIERGSVQAAFQDYLGRPAEPSAVDAYAALPTVATMRAQLRADVAGGAR